MKTRDQRAPVWTVILRRQSGSSVDVQPQAGDTELYELVCIHCGDDSRVTYRDAAPALQRVRGPYPLAAAVATYEQHVGLHARD